MSYKNWGAWATMVVEGSTSGNEIVWNKVESDYMDGQWTSSFGMGIGLIQFTWEASYQVLVDIQTNGTSFDGMPDGFYKTAITTQNMGDRSQWGSAADGSIAGMTSAEMAFVKKVLGSKNGQKVQKEHLNSWFDDHGQSQIDGSSLPDECKAFLMSFAVLYPAGVAAGIAANPQSLDAMLAWANSYLPDYATRWQKEYDVLNGQDMNSEPPVVLLEGGGSTPDPDPDPKDHGPAVDPDKDQNKDSDTKADDEPGGYWRYNDFLFGAATTGGSDDTSGADKDNENSGKDPDTNTGGSKPDDNGNVGTVGQLGGRAAKAIKQMLDQNYVPGSGGETQTAGRSPNWNGTTNYGNPGIDTDNYPPGATAQCFDFANVYLDMMGVPLTRDSTSDDSVAQYQTALKNAGWTIIANPTFSQLSIGALLSEINAPHTEIIVAISGTTLTLATQNPDSPSLKTKDAGGAAIGTGYPDGTITHIAIPPSNLIK